MEQEETIAIVFLNGESHMLKTDKGQHQQELHEQICYFQWLGVSGIDYSGSGFYAV
jgi:hypothetical protein